MALQVAKNVVMEEEDYSSDPLDFETPESVLSLSLSRIPQKFTITTDSYISLASRVYMACCTEIPGFAEHIPESAFQYYAVTLLWKRFAETLPCFPKSGSEFFKEIPYLQDGYLFIPSPLRTYLKGIGHFRDPYNCDRQFVLPVSPICDSVAGITYTFGKVSAKTHFLYEAFPAPGIAALRMMADIKFTKDPFEENVLWDLPQALRPDVVESQIESNKPTKNLLGWAPAQRLNNSQLQLFETLKINDDFLQNNYQTSYTSINRLYEIMFDYLRRAGNSWMLPLRPLPSTGSLVQGMAIERHNESFKFNRSAMYCEGNISVCSPYNLNVKLTKGAVISGYKMAKEPISNRHCWSCYDFHEYRNVPESWIRSRNTVYKYGNAATSHEKLYVSAYVAKRVLQNECILYAMKPKQNWNIYL